MKIVHVVGSERNQLRRVMTETEPDYGDLVAFHGHSCPGLAMGYRMTKAALSFLSNSRSKDEEIVAITENDACGVDALQYLSGCTFGKGNLVFKDYGKQVFTLYNRKSKRGVWVALNLSGIPSKRMRIGKNSSTGCSVHRRANLCLFRKSRLMSRKQQESSILRNVDFAERQ